ncbi:unnamed protein product [Haemonchus placei]|uniref:Uncharacterized protein n=1 Tax=Haemonchus placei TaxID=6290 RepID=A0A3P7Z2L9_HAEPC|nr:unnamed protein product [Haemonchus placei]
MSIIDGKFERIPGDVLQPFGCRSMIWHFILGLSYHRRQSGENKKNVGRIAMKSVGKYLGKEG